MNRQTAFRRLAAFLALIGAVSAFQRPFREYPGVEYDDFPLPPNWRENSELRFAGVEIVGLIIIFGMHFREVIAEQPVARRPKPGRVTILSLA